MENVIQKRLTEYLLVKGLNFKDFETLCGLSNGAASKLSEKSRETTLNRIVEKTDINIKWLLTGEGEMLRKGQNVADVSGSTIVGANVSGNGNSISHNDDSNIAGMIELQKGYQEMIKKSQEQLDRLLAVIENLTK